MTQHDAVVVGSGPNGLAAAVVLARAGLSVLVIERVATIGGATRTLEHEGTGFRFDLGSAIHPLALASPFFREFQLSRRIDLVVPDVSYAHPLADGRAGLAFRDLNATVAGLGRDGRAWQRLFEPLVEQADAVTEFGLNSVVQWPKHPTVALRFAARLFEQGTHLWNSRFRDEIAPAMLSGLFAHSIGKQPTLATAAAGTLLGILGHSVGWPVPVGGSQAIADALASDLLAHGGAIETERTVSTLNEFQSNQLVLLDVSAGQLAELGKDQLPESFNSRLRRFRFGPGVAKVDFALNAPVPWQNPEVAKTATVHLGGTRSAIGHSEAELSRGRIAEHPYVLVAQPSLFDASRAPEGMHTAWAYVHVPSGSPLDATELISREIERFAPGFRDTVLFSHATTAQGFERQNLNFVGGDFATGATTLKQLVARPLLSSQPWKTPLPNVFLCSAATAPGPGVHGMAGYHAARLALAQRGLTSPSLTWD